MNICIFGASFLPRVGGMEYVMHHLATELTRQGHHVTVIAERIKKDGIGTDHNYDVSLYGRKFRGAAKLGIFYVDAISTVLREHRRRQFDVLHCHGVSQAGRRAAVVRKLLGIPVVMTPHGMDIQRIPEINYGVRLNRRWNRIVMHNLQIADAVTTISQSIDYELDTLDRDKVFRVPNGIYLKEYGMHHSNYLRERLGLGGSTKIILSVGRNHVKKGYRYGIEAVEKLVHHYNYRDFNYVLIGKQTGELEPLIAEQGMEKWVTVIEELTREQVRECYHSSQVFFSPSIVEGLSLVSIEAMACGLPLVVTDVPGNRDIIEENDCGMAVCNRDPMDMARGLYLLLTDTVLADQYRRRALGNSAKYDWSVIANRYSEVYRFAMHRNQTGHQA